MSLFYLLAQMAGAGGLVALLLDIKGRTGQTIVIAVVGVLMIVYVLVGGMKGTTWVQIIKAVLLIAAPAMMTVMVLAQVRVELLRHPRLGAAGDLRVGQRGRRQAVTCWRPVPSTADR